MSRHIGLVQELQHQQSLNQDLPNGGKLETQRAEQQRYETSGCSSFQLQSATASSLGLDLATAVDIALINTRRQKIPTPCKRPNNS